MDPLLEFVLKGQEGKVCGLKKFHLRLNSHLMLDLRD